MGLLKVLNDYDAASEYAADNIYNVITHKPNALIALATGNSPLLTYDKLVNKIINEKTDASKCTFIGLDEWVGIPPSDPGSCHYFLYQHIFEPLRLGEKQIHLFNALASDLQEECNKMDDLIAKKSGIDVMVVGVGMNGHIGFNEPGIPWDKHSHVVDLDEMTKTVGQKYFNKVTKLTQGITLGMRHVLESRKVLVLANGKMKAKIMNQAFEGDIGPEMPASIIRKHPDALVVIDRDAASQLTVTGA